MTDEAALRQREISSLCQACGVCCDGTIFSGVDVDPDTTTEVRHRLKMVEGQSSLQIPCVHLAGTRCGVYEIRPSSCRAYECKQVKDHRSVGGSIAARLETVLTIRALSHRLREVARELPVADPALTGSEPAFTHWGLYRALEAGSATNLPPELALDLIELAVRIQRDLGWISPAARESKIPPEPADE